MALFPIISCFIQTGEHPNTYVTLGNLRNFAEVKFEPVLEELCLKSDLGIGELRYKKLKGELCKVKTRNRSHFTLLSLASVYIYELNEIRGKTTVLIWDCVWWSLIY